MNIRIALPEEFKPNPFELMNHIAKEHKNSGLICGFIHGSIVNNKDGVMCGTYKEVRIFKEGTNDLLFSEFISKNQEPDVDIVVVVKNRKKFREYFGKFEKKYNLSKKLNYFLTINSITKRILEREISDKEATALKRILSLRKIWGFGKTQILIDIKKRATNNTKTYDVKFQKEYEKRKNILGKKLRQGVEKFVLNANEYKKKYPLYFAQIWSDTAAGFPSDRDKIVLPRPMDLKVRKDSKSEAISILR